MDAGRDLFQRRLDPPQNWTAAALRPARPPPGASRAPFKHLLLLLFFWQQFPPLWTAQFWLPGESRNPTFGWMI